MIGTLLIQITNKGGKSPRRVYGLNIYSIDISEIKNAEEILATKNQSISRKQDSEEKLVKLIALRKTEVFCTLDGRSGTIRRTLKQALLKKPEVLYDNIDFAIQDIKLEEYYDNAIKLSAMIASGRIAEIHTQDKN